MLIMDPTKQSSTNSIEIAQSDQVIGAFQRGRVCNASPDNTIKLVSELINMAVNDDKV